MARNTVMLIALGDDAPEPVLLAESRYWDGVVRGEELPPTDVDPTVVATIASFHQLDDTPLPRAAFAARLEETLLGTLPSVGMAPGRTTVAVPEAPAPSALPGAHVGWSRRGIPGTLATAALVLLTLGLGYAAVHLRASFAPTSEHQAAPRPTAETLFTTTLAADAIPDSGVLIFEFDRLSLDSSTSSPMSPEGTCCRGPQITHVLSGELTVHVDGPMQVFRGEGNALAGAAAPGSDVVLLPGDTVIHDFSVLAEYANHGTSPVQIVNGQLYTGSMRTVWSSAMHFLDGSQEFHQAPLAAGPVTVSLVRVTLPPDGAFPAPPPGSLVLEVGESGDASVGKASDDSLFNINTRAETIYIIIFEPTGTSSLMP
jgi:hypothetical protein